MSTGKLVVCLSVLFAVSVPVWGETMLPTDDATWRKDSRYDAGSTLGLFTKANGNEDRAYLQFQMGTTAVSSAQLKLYNYWGAPQGKTVEADVRIRGISQSEAGYINWTEEAGPAPSGWASQFDPITHENWDIVVDSFHVNSTPAWYTFDITSYYNANLGEKVTFSVRSINNPAPLDGPIFTDKENVQGNGGGNLPAVDFTVVPEPATLVLALFGGVALLRRRA